MAQSKENSRHLKKQNPCNNKKYKGTKFSYPIDPSTNDKRTKSKGKKTVLHCKFCEKDNHDVSKCFKNITLLEATMIKHNINLESYPKYTSEGHAIFAFVFSFNASSSSSNEYLIDYGACYHMDKDKAMFSTMNECKTKQIFVA